MLGLLFLLVPLYRLSPAWTQRFRPCLLWILVDHFLLFHLFLLCLLLLVILPGRRNRLILLTHL